MVEDEAMRRLDVEDEYCGVKRDRCVKDGANLVNEQEKNKNSSVIN